MQDVLFEEAIKLQNGSSFGDLALLKDKPWQARVVCLTDCEFATLNKSSFDSILKLIEEKQTSLKIKFLNQIPLFSSWSEL